MNFEMNSSLLTPTALTASIALHGIAIIFLADAFFADQNQKISPIQPETAKIKTIEVSLKSEHSDQADITQGDFAIASKPVVQALPNFKKLEPDYPLKPIQPQKQATPHKKFFEQKNNKIAKNKVLNEIKTKPVEKPDVLHSKKSYQDNELYKKSIIPDHSAPLVTQTSSPTTDWRQPNSKSDNQFAANSHSGISKPQLIPAQLTNYSRGISTSLPPLMKSRQPDYPEEARWEERTGKTILKFKISDQGHVIEPQVSKSSGHRDLDLAAIKALQFWRFKATESQALNQWYQYSFRFELN
ncbi:transcriptional regulator TonB family [Methyloglobulus morosus KoM1]|uniref:Transcriptional regulator TonB family n=1 Tax=Methyloglobulus morosus KoM1 TaxID=1116472 RepID=V5C0V7_9GAMM|nr:energy transducer TonB [Methyloglobulus morosus]ESS72087.1 transcriptional regulator TonB family [Methyloglobulus morosus KoM1]